MDAEQIESIDVRGEQVRLLGNNILLLTLANFTAFLCFTTLNSFWIELEELIWDGLFMVVILFQLVVTLLIRRISLDEVKQWRFAMLPGMLLIGILWSWSLMHVLGQSEIHTYVALNIALIGVAFTLTALFISVDSMYSLSYILFSIPLLFYHLDKLPASMADSFLLSSMGYLFGLLLLVTWQVVNLQRATLLGANRNLLHERLQRAEEAVAELSGSLTIERDQRQHIERELYLAKDSAETANLAKSEFLATMSHEIRTPLNGVLPILEMLHETPLEPEQVKLVNTALNSSQLLLSIINDILDFSKIDAGKLDLEYIEIDLRDLVEQVTLLMKNAADRRGLKLGYSVDDDVPRSVRGDPIRLRQILTNLVSNAVKFTDNGQVQVGVEVKSSGHTEVELLFSVTDTGQGMSQQQVERLFEPFSQADASTTRKHGGTGLGLVICKRLTELMGGKIGVESELEKGSCFWFVLPMRRSLKEVPAARSDLTGLRTLIIGHDGGELIKQLTGYLRDWEMIWEFAADQYEAVNKMDSSSTLGASWHYELVIINGDEFGTDLMQVVEELRDLPLTSNLPIAAVGKSHDDARMKQLNVEMITSPLERNVVERKLKRLFDIELPHSSTYPGLDMHIPRMPDAHLAWEDNNPVNTVQSRRAGAADRHTSLVGRVLVVEDNLINQAVMTRMLERLGLTPVTADDGQEAINSVTHESFDMVLMDCQMPVMDGYQATELLREREKMLGLARLPVIAMTANAMSGDRERCIEAGMDDYLSKPVRPADLENMLRQWLPMRETVEQGAVQEKPASGTESTSDQGGTVPDHYELEVEPDSELANGAGEAEAFKIIDLEALEALQEILGDEFITILKRYRESTPDLMHKIRDALKDRDLAAMAGAAHSLKSSSANVGAMRLSEYARQLEHLGREGKGSKIKPAYTGLVEAYRGAMSELGKIIERGSLS